VDPRATVSNWDRWRRWGRAPGVKGVSQCDVVLGEGRKS
jgi:hypothetical protein